MELVYIGEEYTSLAFPYVKSFQDKGTGKQYGWAELSDIMCNEVVAVRPATPDEMEAAWASTCLVLASLAFLNQLLKDGMPDQPAEQANEQDVSQATELGAGEA